MPKSQDNLAKIFDSVGGSVKQVLTQPRVRADGRGPVFARARLKRAKITEKYYVRQKIAKNPTEGHGKAPAGLIEIVVPYDGDRFFTRQAREDVARGLTTHPQDNETATIGHLLLREYDKTTLRDDLNLPDRYGSVPIEVSVIRDGSENGDGEPDGLTALTADRQTCVIRYEFKPDQPDVLPAKLEIQLFDPDSLDLPDLDLESPEGRKRIIDIKDMITKKIRRQMSFRNEIVLHIVARLTLPKHPDLYPGLKDLKPKVARMSIEWPAITSLRTVNLQVGAALPQLEKETKYKSKLVQYNPVTRSLEWENVEIHEKPGSHPDLCAYESAPMLLFIEHPGEFYRENTLNARAEIKIAGYLMSGLGVRLYDATGHESVIPQPVLTTSVEASATLLIDDAFLTREFSPYQHLFFEEVIPDEMRITDIRTALRDQGFTPWLVAPDDEDARQNTDSDSVNWLLVAYRQEGPHKMFLWISVEGRKFIAERKRIVVGREVVQEIETGEMTIFLWGKMKGDHTQLTREMNALQSTLRERYSRVRRHT